MTRRRFLAGLEQSLADLEETDPEVRAARDRYDDAVDRLIGRNGKLSIEEVHRIYDGGGPDES